MIRTADGREEFGKGEAALVAQRSEAPSVPRVHYPIYRVSAVKALAPVSAISESRGYVECFVPLWLAALYELYAVAVGIANEEDAGAAVAHGVGLALEVHAAGLF